MVRNNRSGDFFALLTTASLVIAAGTAVGGVWLPALWSLLAAVFAAESRRTSSRKMGFCSIFLLIITLFAIHENNCETAYLSRLLNNMICYGSHGLSIIVTAELLRKSKNSSGDALFTAAPLILSVMGGIYLFVYLTMEAWSALGNYLPEFKLGGISVLWGITGLGMVVCGIFKNISALRKTGAFLFMLTCLKVLLLDMAAAALLWEIVCCIVIGMILLAAAVIYIRQRNRFPIKNDQETETEHIAGKDNLPASPSPLSSGLENK